MTGRIKLRATARKKAEDKPRPPRRLSKGKVSLGTTRQDQKLSKVKDLLDSGVTFDEVQDELCRRKLAPFVRRVVQTLSPSIPYRHNWHIDLICEYLECVHNGDIKRLIINLPPRFLKSMIASVAYPAWLLGRAPNERVLCASYVDTLAVDLSVKCRRVMQSDWYMRMFPETRFAPDQNEKKKYETTKGGYRSSVGIGGSVLGFGGRYKILDDPLDPEGGFSLAEKQRTLRWLDNVWPSRSDDPENTREILIMQRISVDDPTGHLLKQSDDWTVLKLPMEASERKVITFPKSGKKLVRAKDELLHESYYGAKLVKQAKARGTYAYSSQYQQEPIPMGGGRIKMHWFPRYGAFKDTWDEVVISADTANKPGKLNDPTAMLVFARSGKQWHLIDLFKDKLAYPDLYRTAIAMDDKHGGADTFLIEDKSSGQSLIQDLKDKTNIPVIAVEPEADKITRMDTQTGSLEAGVIALPDQMQISAPWMLDLEVCLSAFPDPPEWDMLDALSQFLKWLRKRNGEEVLVVMPEGMSSGGSHWAD